MHTILGPNAELNPRKMWKDWEDRIVVHDVDGRPLENGQILEIFPTSQAEAPDMDILQLQWDILRMHALTGGADPVLYAPDNDYDEDGRRVSVDRPERVRALEALKDNRVELEAERPMETSPDVPEATMSEVAEVASTGRSVSGTSTLRNMAATAVNSISRRTGRAIRRLGGDDGDDSTILSGRPTTPSITRGLVSRLRPRRVSHAMAGVQTTASSADRGDHDRPFTEVDAPRSARSSGEHSQRRRQSRLPSKARLPSESRPSIEARHRTRSGRPSGEHPHKNRLSTEASTAQGGGRPSGEHSQKNRLSTEAATAQGGGRLSGEQMMLPLRPRPGTVLGEITNVASTRVTTRMSEDDAVGGENRDPAQTDVNH
ncbi:hypothetical protein CH063_06543 [Colletotrichum higginsianum]|nr:hypothetical protein CH063_06543 [Colletotrichum higginsianum]